MSSDSYDSNISNSNPEDDLLREMESLRAENTRLRGLLGLDERADDGRLRRPWCVHALGPNYRSDGQDFRQRCSPG